MGEVDPTYVRTAEATGGKVMLFAPDEISGTADDMLASNAHQQVVFRAGGPVDDGVHEFDFPIDSTIESAYVFVALQCLQFAALVQPSGELLPTDATTVTYREFAAVRLFTIKAPTPGAWKIRVAGRGFSSVIVSARTGLALTSVSFVRNGRPVTGLAPLGETVRLEAATQRESGAIAFQFVSMRSAPLQEAALTLGRGVDGESTYAATVTLPASDFRLMMTGTDAKGFPFQRVTPQLFIGRQ